jgi:hypothetical protein
LNRRIDEVRRKLPTTSGNNVDYEHIPWSCNDLSDNEDAQEVFTGILTT